jgi:hypothetical protein
MCAFMPIKLSLPLKDTGCPFYGEIEHGSSIAQKACQHRNIPASNRTQGPDKKTNMYYGFSNKNPAWNWLFYNNGLMARMHELT